MSGATRVRLALEILGAILFLAAQVPVVLLYLLGSTLGGVSPGLYWGAIAAGYLVMLGVALARPGPLGELSPRDALDRWLVAAIPALGLTAGMIALRWPLDFPSWDAHGLGAAGGEVNSAILPWLHGALWVASGWIGPRR